MKPVFADTSYYVALLSEQDAWHERAKVHSEAQLGRVLTTEYVLVETASMMARRSARDAFVALVKDLEVDESTVLIQASPELFRIGFDLFAERPDKEWSLVDCISFVIMKHQRLRDALTSDHHFVQAGFRALLR